MSFDGAFTPRGNTIALSAVATSVNAAATNTHGDASSYLIANPSANAVFFAFAPAGATAPVAVAPIAGTPATGFCVPAGTSRIITGLGPNAQWAAIALVAGPSLVYITPGMGGVA